MFKRKKIIIGETYLYDVLNETNMAVLTNLVTVVKKSKRNKYIVVSVNNGDVFETDAEFLTPYVNPAMANVIRCHYGATEFEEKDLLYFDFIDSVMELFESLIDEVKDITDLKALDIPIFMKVIEKTKESTKIAKSRVQKYVDISNYKRFFSVIRNVFNDKIETNKPKAVFCDRPFNNINDKDFKDNFDKVVGDYIYGENTISEFIEESEETIKKYYPKEFLINDNSELNVRMVNDIICNIIDNVRNLDSIAIIIGMDDNEQWHITSIYFDTETDGAKLLTDFRKYIYNLYPMLEQNGCCYPKYKFNILNIRKKGQYEDYGYKEDNE